jgi:hypothetical protein
MCEIYINEPTKCLKIKDFRWLALRKIGSFGSAWELYRTIVRHRLKPVLLQKWKYKNKATAISGEWTV